MNNQTFTVIYLGDINFKRKMQQKDRFAFVRACKKYFLPDDYIEGYMDGVRFSVNLIQVGENDYQLTVRQG